MPSLGDILNQVPTVANATTQQRQELLDRVYDKLKTSGKITSGKLRQYRQDQMDTFLEDDKKEAEPVDYEAGGSSFLGASISQYMPKDRETYARISRRNTLEDLRDVGRIVSDPTQIGAGIKKTTQDLLGLGMSLWASSGGMEAAGLTLTNKATGETTTPSFGEALNTFNNLENVKKTNEWYNEVIKDDPDLAKRYHAVVTDAVLGSIFGAARVGKAAQALSEVGAVKSGLTKLREFFAPVVSNVVGGQVVYSGLEGIDKALTNTELSDETKTGVRLGSMLALGLASGIGPERFIENVITNDSKAVNLAINLGKMAKVAESAGIDFREALARNPDLSEEARQVLGIDTIPNTDVQNLEPTSIDTAAANVADTTNKLTVGQELSIEDANIGKALHPEVPINPIKPEEMAEKLGELSKQVKTNVEEVATPSSANIAQEVEKAATATPKTYTPSRVSTPNKEKVVREAPTWDSISLSRRALETLDMLTSTGRSLQAAIKQAEKVSDVATVEALTKQLDNVKAQVADAQTLITLEMGGSRTLIRLVNNEIKSIGKQLTKLRRDWKVATPEKRIEIENQALDLKNRLQLMNDRKIVFQRIPSGVYPSDLAAIRAQREAKAATRKPEPSKPFVEKINREDAETKLNQLPETERIRALKLSQASQQGIEDILGRPLIEPERLDVLARVLDNERAWSNNPFTPSDTIFAKTADKEPLVLAGYVGKHYPLAGQVLNTIHPGVATSGVYTPDQVLQLAQALVARSGFGMDSQGWALQRDILEQTFKLWDEVRGSISKAEGSNLKTFLKTAMPNSKPGTIKKVADTINNAFPELDLSFKADALPKGVAATADALSKLVTVGLNKVGLKELMHEIGHLNFWHGMDSDARLSWMEGMRTRANDEVSWANAFPEYAERQMANATLDEVGKANAEFWMHNPSEMYAQQFSAYVLSNVIPNVETLGTFQRAWRGLKRTMGMATDNWESLPMDTKELLLKTLVAPSPIEAKLIPSAEIDEGLKSSWLYSDRDTSEARVFEIRQALDATYGQRMEQIPTSETLISDVVQDVPTASFFDLPVEQRVASYALNDLPQVAEMQALSILHDLPGASWDELRLTLKRLHNDLSGERRADLMDAIVASMQPASSKYSTGFDPITKQRLDVSTGISYSREEIADINRSTAIGEYNRLDAASKKAIAADNARKYKREWFVRKEAAQRTLEQAKESGEITSYTQDDVVKLADRIWDERPGNTIEGSAMATYREMQEVATTTEQLYSQAAKQLAAMDVMVDDLTDFTKYVLASKGMVQPIDPSFAQRLSRAEQYAQIASGKANWRWPELMLKTGIQGAYVGLTGLEYDPDGTYIPFLGTVRWNPETFLETAPLGVLLLPGSWSSLKWLSGKGTQLTKPYVDKAISKLPGTTRLRLEGLSRSLRKAFLASGGLPSDLAQMIRSAQVYGTSKKQDFYAFAETMHRHFTPEERELIAKVYAQEPGTRDLIFDIAEHRPDVLAAIEMTKKLYSTIPNTFKSLGLWSKNFEDLGDHYINRFYDGIGKKPASAIFLNYNIAPISGNFLKKRGLEAIVKDGKSADVGQSSIDSFTQLQRNSQESGIELREGLKLNSWEAKDGSILYSIPGTAYDDSLRGQKLVPMHQWDDKGTGYVITEVRNKSFKVRRDYTPEERKGMGEVVDVAIRSAAMGEQLERDLRQGRAFYNIANSSYAKRTDDSDEIAALIDQGWTKVDDSLNNQTGLMKYGALAGMYIHPDAKLALQSLNSNQITAFLQAKGLGGALKVHRALLNGWKVSKTVLAPVAHVNNFVSNMFMGHLMGHNVGADLTTGLRMSSLRNMEIRAKNLTKEGKFEEAAQLIERMKQHEYYSYFAEMRDARMSDSSLWATELNSDDLLQELRAAKLSESASDLGTIQKYMQAGYNAISTGVKKSVKFAGSWYEKGDLIYKMGAFVNARKQGMTPNEAVKYAYEAYFDYGNLSPVAKALRDSGLVPFVSYMYNAIPAMAKSITQHPERLAGIALLLEGLHLASVGAVYGPEDLIAKREAVDMAMPDYMQKRGLGGILRTRILNPFGSSANLENDVVDLAKHQFLDITRMVPGGDLFESAPSINNVDFSLSAPGELLFTFINQSPIISAATTMATGRNPQLGYSIVSGGDVDTEATRSRKNEEVIKLIWNTIVPNLPFLPGTPTNIAIGEALAGQGYIDGYGNSSGLDAMGLPKSLGTAVSGAFGLKFRDLYPEVTLTKKITNLEYQTQKERSRLNKIFSDARYTEAYKEQELKNFEQTAGEVAKRQSRRVEMLERINAMRQARQGGQSLPH